VSSCYRRPDNNYKGQKCWCNDGVRYTSRVIFLFFYPSVTATLNEFHSRHVFGPPYIKSFERLWCRPFSIRYPSLRRSNFDFRYSAYGQSLLKNLATGVDFRVPNVYLIAVDYNGHSTTGLTNVNIYYGTSPLHRVLNLNAYNTEYTFARFSNYGQ